MSSKAYKCKEQSAALPDPPHSFLTYTPTPGLRHYDTSQVFGSIKKCKLLSSYNVDDSEIIFDSLKPTARCHKTDG